MACRGEAADVMAPLMKELEKRDDCVDVKGGGAMAERGGSNVGERREGA